ncbi:transporter [Marinobacterium nitratireducens]|uniref:Transporter n=1 Tax=Marinobacterium nitratireducens TaxID=518897 RepID=A0A918DWL1_9GAMM|nr:AEC family transporter [Marinobacterium nitratireducens]GGO87756.1 transporter [Marinobacterium nitratireducens]
MIQMLSMLWPVFALLMLGVLARRLDFPGEAFWPLAEKATYFVLFPVLLVSRLSQADISGVSVAAIGTGVLLLLLAGSACCYLLRPLLRLPGPSFTSFYQGAMRFNTYVGLAAVAAIHGATGVAVSAVVIAFMIPMLNVLCVLVLSYHAGASAGLGPVLHNLIRNPLILACLLGMLLNYSGIGMPAPLRPVAELLGQMALPLGLLAVGAGLSLRALRQVGPALLASSSIKLLLFPLLALGIARLLGLSALGGSLLVLFASMPTASSAYILARQLGGDAPMMAAIITGQTLLSALTIPLMLGWLVS